MFVSESISPFKVKAIQFMKKSSALKHWIPSTVLQGFETGSIVWNKMLFWWQNALGACLHWSQDSF